MNFNEEMERELQGLGLGGKVVPIRPEDKGTAEDWAELERKVRLRVHGNEVMLAQSMINADFSVLG